MFAARAFIFTSALFLRFTKHLRARGSKLKIPFLRLQQSSRYPPTALRLRPRVRNHFRVSPPTTRRHHGQASAVYIARERRPLLSIEIEEKGGHDARFSARLYTQLRIFRLGARKCKGRSYEFQGGVGAEPNANAASRGRKSVIVCDGENHAEESLQPGIWRGALYSFGMCRPRGIDVVDF